MDVLLGLDLGTTNIKGVAYSTAGMPLVVASRSTPTIEQGLRRACHDPQTLWGQMAAVIREVVSGLPVQTRPVGLAIASIGEAGVPLDAHGDVLYPLIAWYDERTAPQAAWWAQHMGEVEIYRHTGLPLGHTFTLNKLLWLREEEPEVYARLSRWLCVSDYMAYRLTGEQLIGYSLASRTMAFDLRERRWSEEMLSCAGIAPAIWPPVCPEGTLVGYVTPDAAHQTGLAQGTPVYVGGHDHVCGALAMGVFVPGIVLDSTGTTEAELTTLDSIYEYIDAGDLSFCLGCHVARGRYYTIGSILGAGSMVSWLAELLWNPEHLAGGDEALQALTLAASMSPPGARGLYLLPHLAGAGSPDRDSTARGVFVGLSLAHTRADMARAAMEGLSYELRLLWAALEQFTHQPIRRVISVGGGARNALWSQIKADITGRALAVPEHTEAATLGAALLAGLGAGVYRDEEHALRCLMIPTNQVHPQAESVRCYDRFFQQLMGEIRPLAVELGRKSYARHSSAAAIGL